MRCFLILPGYLADIDTERELIFLIHLSLEDMSGLVILNFVDSKLWVLIFFLDFFFGGGFKLAKNRLIDQLGQ